MIPIPTQFDIPDSDSSQNQSDSGIDSDSGIGIVHHCLVSSRIAASNGSQESMWSSDASSGIISSSKFFGFMFEQKSRK